MQYIQKMCVWLNEAQMKAKEMNLSLNREMMKKHFKVINLNICKNDSNENKVW